MTGLMVQKQLKELASRKSDLVFMGAIIIACGIVVPLFSNVTFAIMSVFLTMSFIAQMAPGIFVEEKDSRSLETLVTLPVGMRQIVYGKVLACFLVSVLLFWLSFGLGLLVSFAKYKAVPFTLEQALGFAALVPLAFWAFSWQCTYTSLKAKDTGVCALTLTFVSILYAVPPVLLFVFLVGQIDTVVSLFGRSIRIDPLVILIAYALVLAAAFVLLRLLMEKYFDKAKIFGLLRN